MKNIAGRFWLIGSIYDDVIKVKTSFDATTSTEKEIRHIEGFYSSHGFRVVAEIINQSTIELRKIARQEVVTYEQKM